MKRPIVIVLLTVALTLVCLGIGGVLFFTFNGGLPDGNPFEILAQVEESETLKVDLEKPLTLNVLNDAGDVTIVGADVDTAQVNVTKKAYANSQAKADEAVKAIKYSITQTGNVITIKYELPNLNNINSLEEVDFVITVPNEITVDVNDKFGEINVSNIKGAVALQNDFGDIDVENVEGALSALSNSGELTAASIRAGTQNIELKSDFGSVTLKQASGKDVTLTSNSGKITFDEVRATGDITTQTDFGDTEFENGSADSLSIVSKSGKLSLSKLNVTKQIKVNSDFGEIELEQVVGGSYDLHTNSGSVTVDGAKGSLKASTGFGGIKIENAQSVTLDLVTKSGSVEFNGSLGEGPHKVVSEFGEINLTLPSNSALTVDLKTGFGNIKSDLPITVTLTGSSNPRESDQIVGSINGGGAQLTVQTSSGNITIRTSAK